ncbi:hypothetical protein [Phocaeicola plebeius]|uniref:hypothetical protein n=1 Tax=Phocaeicola plebeius TaxID=310297 RepID=UPI003522F255
MAAEEDFVLSFTGEETDNLLKHAESMKNQTTADDGETVQVYDTNGVPHKVSKTELLKKSTLALPALEDISSFVAINAAGNAVGVMTKEQVASVLAELGGYRIPRSPIVRRRKSVDANNIEDGLLIYPLRTGLQANTNGLFWLPAFGEGSDHKCISDTSRGIYWNALSKGKK